MKAPLQKETSRPTNRAEQVEYRIPVVNIFETKEGYVLEAEMSGVNKDGLEITLEGTDITIVGRRASEVVSGQALVRERSIASFRRVFELDPAIDTSKINAKMNQGVLTLTLPKTEGVKPRKITVND